MANSAVKEKILIPKREYLRLKKVDQSFGDFLNYLENIIDIREARKEVKQKKLIPQEKLFKQLGL